APPSAPPPRAAGPAASRPCLPPRGGGAAPPHAPPGGPPAMTEKEHDVGCSRRGQARELEVDEGPPVDGQQRLGEVRPREASDASAMTTGEDHDRLHQLTRVVIPS